MPDDVPQVESVAIVINGTSYPLMGQNHIYSGKRNGIYANGKIQVEGFGTLNVGVNCSPNKSKK